ncbi:MAG TPA: N-acetylmuramoyl-L-alanine amidase [Clostridium sp.]|nr:N-acetylmuramoyl-L-alanine amidase [Clostridium sp.]
MRIGNRYGHTKVSPGARGIIDELAEGRKIIKELNSLLSVQHNLIDCQPPEDSFYPQKLNYGINKANSSNLDMYFSIHFNNAYERYDGALGSEIWVYDRNSKLAIEKAAAILKNLENLGFKNRGIKYLVGSGRSLGELENTNCEAMIIEVCFVEATKDVEIYKRAGVKNVAKAIADAFENKINKNLKYGTVTADILNVRNGRSISHDIIGELKYGDKVRLCYLLNGWWSIDYGKGVGYISGDFIRLL